MRDKLDMIVDQYQAFALCTVGCDQCKQPTPLGRVQPVQTAHVEGLVLFAPIEFLCPLCMRALVQQPLA